MAAEVHAIDANVILRHLLADHDELSPRARDIFEAVESGSAAVVCDPVILAEAVWVLRSTYKLPADRIAEELLNLVALEHFRMPNKQLYVDALRLFASGAAHFGDACACALARSDCQGRLLSFDRKLSGVEGITRTESV